MGNWNKWRNPRRRKAEEPASGHQERPRSEVVQELADKWETHWYVPAIGMKLMMLLPPLFRVPGVELFLDSTDGEHCMHIHGAEALMLAFAVIPGELGPGQLAGLFTIPRTTPQQVLRDAFPGHFATPLGEQKVVLLVTREEMLEGGVRFPSLLLDAAMYADPEAADGLASHLADP
jgi:hypothetical protein